MACPQQLLLILLVLWCGVVCTDSTGACEDGACKARAVFIPAAKPKLTYFDGRGLGELPRLVLAELGVEFEDNRLNDIKHLKPTLPFGQVPLYEEGTKIRLVQSNAIARYLARRGGLYGNTEEDGAHIDMIMDGVRDVRVKKNPLHYFKEVPEDLREARKEKFRTELLPQWAQFFENMLQGRDWFLPGGFSVADIAVFDTFSILQQDMPEAFEKTPLLVAHSGRVAQRPGIAAWLKQRPQSDW